MTQGARKLRYKWSIRNEELIVILTLNFSCERISGKTVSGEPKWNLSDSQLPAWKTLVSFIFCPSVPLQDESFFKKCKIFLRRGLQFFSQLQSHCLFTQTARAAKLISVPTTVDTIRGLLQGLPFLCALDGIYSWAEGQHMIQALLKFHFEN